MNDNGKKKYGSTHFNDIHVLNLINFTWIQVNAYGKHIEARSMHASFIVDNKLVCFGGLNENGFIGHHIDVCEMDSNKARAQINAIKFKQKPPSVLVKERQKQDNIKIMEKQMVFNKEKNYLSKI